MEEIYNLFLFFENGRCSSIGCVAHQFDGSDEDGCEFLRSQLEVDFKTAKKISLVRSFTLSEYNAKCRLGEGLDLCEEVFFMFNAVRSPLCMITPVDDGKLSYNYSSDHSPLSMKDVWGKFGRKDKMIDWLEKYRNGNEIDLVRLIHDDYFIAIKLTYNEGLYVSSMKLLLSCIDSLSYIEYGNVKKPHPFIGWLDTYADLSSIGVSSSELWELRNGILHMTNISSAKVRDNKVRRVSFKVGGDRLTSVDADGICYFHFYSLICVFSEAVKRWIESYNNDRDKMSKFVERYDETISDSRASFISLKNLD